MEVDRSAGSAIPELSIISTMTEGVNVAESLSSWRHWWFAAAASYCLNS